MSDSTPERAVRSADLRRRIVAEARSCLGTPFHHQGRQPGVGLDCVGLVAVVGRRLGLLDYDRLVYPRRPRGDELERHAVAAGMARIPEAAALPGDVLMMRFFRDPQHVAIVTGRGIIHAHMRARGVVEHSLDPSWRQRIVAAFRFPGL